MNLPNQPVIRIRFSRARMAALGASAAIAFLPAFAALAETFDNPADWKAAAGTDFAVEDEGNAPYFEIWRHEIGENNAAALVKGVAIPEGYQAHIEEAHWSIRSPPKIAAVTILDFQCDPAPVFSNAAVEVVRCPTKTIVWSGPLRTVRDQPKSCFIRRKSEGAAAPASSIEDANARDGVFMAFDVASQSIKIGLLVGGRTIDICSHYLALGAQ
jgi:hypothetical protein